MGLGGNYELRIQVELQRTAETRTEVSRNKEPAIILSVTRYVNIKPEVEVIDTMVKISQRSISRK